MGGPEGAGPGTAGELADPASLWATRAGEAGYQDVMGRRAGRVWRALSPGVFPPRALLVLASFTESLLIAWGFPGDPVVNNVPAKAGDTGSIPGLGRFSERRKWQPTPGFLPGKSHAQGSLAGYSPWGGEESDRIGRVNSGSS